MTDTNSIIDSDTDSPSQRTLLDRVPAAWRTRPVLILGAVVVVLLVATIVLAVVRPSGEDPAASACRAFASDQWETYEFVRGLKEQLAASRNEKLRLAGKALDEDYPFIIFIEAMNQGCAEIGEPIPFPDVDV